MNDNYAPDDDKYEPERGLRSGFWVGAITWAVLIAVGIFIFTMCSGCSSYTSRRTGTLGGRYESSVERTPLGTTAREEVEAPSRGAVESAMLSDALRLCLAQRERQAEMAVGRDTRRSGTRSGGFVAVVPPQHPTTMTDDYVICSCIARGGDPATCFARGSAPVRPDVVPTWGGWSYGQPTVPFSGTGGAPGVR